MWKGLASFLGNFIQSHSISGKDSNFKKREDSDTVKIVGRSPDKRKKKFKSQLRISSISHKWRQKSQPEVN